ncbi:MAG: glycoside hydrolase family 3 C-terminal domain-containing protein [Candidatus Marinimicrobia bacterium]|nr:glycoside hydrolase family 3 C-terminal domain-containing protein [bacterium]MCG2715096.1 glycoside hydrolase family 3 C-terminal domain-containing protein [Candidatus Neomarinimicrobiota bacterium]
MKKRKFVFGITIFVMISIFLFSCQKQDKSSLSKKVEDLLAQMTLEEKIGQMTQVAIQVVSKTQGAVDQIHELDQAKLEEAIIKYHVGSILSVWDIGHSVDYWQEVITRIQDVATKKTRLGIPIIYGIDAIHGVNYTKGSTIFPQSIAMAATWNPELVRKEGEITACEMRDSGIPWNFNPVLGLGRQPLWPRLFETYGEDVYLASLMGAKYVKGLQGNDISNPEKVAACAKHYVGYSFPLSGKDRSPAWIPDRMLRELFLPPFKSAIDAGAATVMVNSSEVNGIPVHSSYYLLTEVLRNELGFEGFVVSDWADINQLHLREKVAPTQKEAVRLAVMAGIDMSMVPMDFSFYNILLELVNEGLVPIWRIDEAVSRILKVKFELGLFKNPYPNKKLKKKFACDEFKKVNLQAAREAITLLKNDDELLPLSKDKKIFVTGPAANSLSVLNSGWTITWQGDREDLYPKNKKTILQAVENKAGAKNVTYLPGVTFDREINIDAAVKTARNSDVAIVCIGERPYCETLGNIDDLTMTQPQLKLAKAIEETGVPVVLVLVEGRPRIINGIVDDADAILMAYLPGMEGGSAVADVLFGDFNPCGKLPITYPGYTNSLMCYDYKNSEISKINDYDAQFPFGYGLSYTKFEYSDLKLDKAEINESDELNVQVTVKNTGEITGKEVVQLYLSDLFASVTPSVKRLKRFSKILLEPGETKTVEFTLFKDDLSFIGRDNKPFVEPGEFEITIADLKEKFELR